MMQQIAMTRKQHLEQLCPNKSQLKIVKQQVRTIDGKRVKIKPFALMTMREKYLFNEVFKIGYLDIESSGLSADFDFMISYAILVRDISTGKTSIRKARINIKDLEYAKKKGDADLIDERILKQLMEDISDLDVLIGHWFIGKHRHDIPFIRSRMAINKVSGFPKYRMIKYGDTQKWTSQIHRLRNNGLATIADAYDLSTHKTPVTTKAWKKAAMFADKKSIDYIMDHNIKDVIITYKVHKHLEQYVPLPTTYC